MKTIEKSDGDELYFMVNRGDEGEMVHEVKLRLLSPAKCNELRMALERALKTWEPEKAPGWLVQLQDALTGMAVVAAETPKDSSVGVQRDEYGRVAAPWHRHNLCASYCVSRHAFKRDFCLCKGEDKEIMK